VRILRWAGRIWTGLLVVTVALAGVLLALRAVMPIFAAPPALRAAMPAEGAADVSTRAPIQLQFDQSMNARSVEAALSISPPLAWKSVWDASRTTLTISPTELLRPATDYQIALGRAALNRRFRALPEPLELHFRTAQAPAVSAALPANGAADVPLDSPISLSFSREIVQPDAVQQPGALPALRFEPPLAGQATWLDTTTVLFRPSAPLQAGTRYRATLESSLADINGGQLGSAYSWEFSTAAPRVLALEPADGARLVPPDATLAITLSQPLELGALRATLLFSPTISGAFATTTLADGRQRVTFTPSTPLRAETTYTGTLRAGSASNLPLIEPAQWRFSTAPRPTLAARFPGEGQTLPNGQEVRLVFTTPMDSDAVQAALALDPPAPNVRVSASAAEVRIRADLRAATVYTLTLPADLSDRNGIALGQPYQMRFVTAPAGPALELPELQGNLAQVPPDAAGGLLLRRTNLSSIAFDLYQLDEPTLVRLLDFRAEDWPNFQPERYGQQQLRTWRTALSDPLNAPAEERLPLTDERGEALGPGIYYLRMRTLEGPHADLVLLVSRARLSAVAGQQNDGAGAAQVWATDITTGEALAGLPIALYQGGALVQQATTDAQGLAAFTGLGGANGFTVVAGGQQPGAAILPPARSRPQLRLFLAADRAAYAPGETVQLAGFVRDAQVGAFPSISVVATGPDGSRAYQQTAQPATTGIFTASVVLPADARAGTYTISARAGSGSAIVRVAVQPPPAAPLRVEVQTPGPLVGGDDLTARVEVSTAEGLPLAGAPITWTLLAEREPFAGAGEFVFGDAERATAPIEARSGVAQSDADGRFTLSLADADLADVPLRYRLVAEASGPGGAAGVGAGEFSVAPAERSAGVALPSQIFTIGRSSPVELLALDAAGQPAPRTRIRVEVYTRSWEPADPSGGAWVPRDRIAFTRSAVSGADGRARLQLALPRGGAYRLRISTPESADNAVYSAVSAWASAPGFAAWGALPNEELLLVADRASYGPGDTATLLLAGLSRDATVLLAWGSAAGPRAETRAIRAGQPFTLTLPTDASSSVAVRALIALGAPSASGAATPAPLPSASIDLPISSERAALQVAVAADRAAYLPGGTATLTITTTDSNGQGVPADLILALGGARPPASAPIEAALRALPAALQSGAPPSLTAAALPGTGRGIATPPEPAGAWRAGLRTNASGVLTVTLTLPDEPALAIAQVWAASADRAGQARATLPISQPVDLAMLAPPAARPGDEVLLLARARNTDAITHTVGAQLSIAGLELNSPSETSQQATLAPGAQHLFIWRTRAIDAAGIRGAVAVRVEGALFQTEPIELPILANAVQAPANRGLAIARDYLDAQTGLPLDLGALRPGQLVRARLTIVAPAAVPALSVTEPLPASATLFSAPVGALGAPEIAPASLAFTRAELGPGIVQYEYTFRLSAAGRYKAPATIARSAAGAQAAGPAADFVVATP
jgi:hypothetical protein